MADIFAASEADERRNPEHLDPYSFGALLEHFFETSPLGKELSETHVLLDDPEVQELFQPKKPTTTSEHTRRRFNGLLF